MDFLKLLQNAELKNLNVLSFQEIEYFSKGFFIKY